MFPNNVSFRAKCVARDNLCGQSGKAVPSDVSYGDSAESIFHSGSYNSREPGYIGQAVDPRSIKIGVVMLADRYICVLMIQHTQSSLMN